MSSEKLYGYKGSILRVDLSKGKALPELLNEAIVKDYVGGAALGMKYIYDEVPPGVEWSDPANHLYIGSGPLGGTRVGGSGGIAVVTKGALTNGMASTQAQGFFGAFLRFSGFDAIVLQGAAAEWTYLYIHDGIAEFKDASHLVGKNTFEIDHLIKQELQKEERELSVLSIGPAGENLVKFACISADMGHMASHNGVGAVMGSKKLKAIAVSRGKNAVPLYDKEAMSQIAKEILANTLADKMGSMGLKEGTVGGVVMSTRVGFLPVKNYTTSLNNMTPEVLETYGADKIRSKFNARCTPCWACTAKHCHMMEIPEGKYAGLKFEEPEYEGVAAFSSVVGIQDITTTMVLASEVDRLGMDTNEAGWLFGWLLECYEKRLLTSKDTDGLEMTWGNGEAIMAMLKKTANRNGFGNILAEGVMRAAQKIGGEAQKLAVYTQKGNTPRGHDHRAVWMEMFDTVVSNTGTLEAHQAAPYRLLGITMPYDTYNYELVSMNNAKIKGAMIFEDSVITCRYNTSTALDLMCKAVNAATGWNLDFRDAMRVGKRAVNLARAFNILHGVPTKLDAPSMRYGSMPLDGIAAGKSIMWNWDKMVRNYYKHMGWDEETGKPLPETLKSLGLDSVVPKLWA